MPVWLYEAGPESDIVVSSRVRLARNLSGELFPSLLDKKGADGVLDKVKKTVFSKKADFELKDFSLLSPIEKAALAEKRLCSVELAESGIGALIVSRDETISIMVNEEDHLRIQCLLPGQQLQAVLAKAGEMDKMLGEKLGFAYDDRLGYLTSCPTNVGTGLRASLMMHLPALELAGQMPGIVHTVGQMGQTVRGLYGEGSSANGCLYQLSNQVTLGVSEEDILNSLDATARSVMEKERALSSSLHRQRGLVLEDKLWRSLGIAKSARVLDTAEFMSLWSDIKWGASLGIFKNIDLAVLHNLMMEIQPATLQLAAGKPLEAQDRDAYRAEVVRRAIEQIINK
ncbi:MAG: protein arginine kinase [Bacillota bacterium]|nr:protein arginine kinase [Bacillota bacterium]